MLIDSHSPYYLHPSKGPGMTITSVIFNGKNYDLWQQAIRTALGSKNKLGFIEGTLKRAELKEGVDPTEYNAWDMVNSMVCSWIINVIDPKLHSSIAYIETATVMWRIYVRGMLYQIRPRYINLKLTLLLVNKEVLR